MAIIFITMTLNNFTKWNMEFNLTLKLKTMNQRQIELYRSGQQLAQN